MGLAQTSLFRLPLAERSGKDVGLDGFVGFVWVAWLRRAGCLRSKRMGREVSGGETGIRTLDTLRYTRFPSVRLKPLGHLSAQAPGNLLTLSQAGDETKRAAKASMRDALRSGGHLLGVTEDKAAECSRISPWLGTGDVGKRELSRELEPLHMRNAQCVQGDLVTHRPA